MMKKLWIRGLCAPLILLLAVTSHADGKSLVAGECAGCHAISAPAEAVADRGLAPPLYFAGNKFRRDWLVQWLQAPTRIRPAGYDLNNHVVSSPEGDAINEESLVAHQTLSEAQANEAADFLMSLQPFTNLLESAAYTPGNISWRMGQLNFGKFNGCDSCHQDAADYGGVSGPELYTAWDRLQPGFIASFIKDPTLWQPDALMPDTNLSDAVISKLANYLKVAAEEDAE